MTFELFTLFCWFCPLSVHCVTRLTGHHQLLLGICLPFLFALNTQSHWCATGPSELTQAVQLGVTEEAACILLVHTPELLLHSLLCR